MDTQNLQTFITVVKLGSFTKTAEQSFISPTAVMKQMNKLEDEMNCRLLERSSAGVRLTSQGEKFFPLAQQMMDLAQEAYLACQTQHISIRLGSSLLHPGQPFLAIWDRIKEQLPQYQVNLTALPSYLSTSNREYEALGHSCDIVIGTFDEATTHSLVDAISLGAYRLSIALSNQHPLTKKDSLSLTDLAGLTLLMVPKGISQKNDQLRADILKVLPDIDIVETDGRYDLDTFNQAVNQGYALINLTPWESIHPGLTSIPLESELTVEYGILAQKKAPTHVRTFLKNVQYHILTKMGDYGPLK